MYAVYRLDVDKRFDIFGLRNVRKWFERYLWGGNSIRCAKYTLVSRENNENATADMTLT